LGDRRRLASSTIRQALKITMGIISKRGARLTRAKARKSAAGRVMLTTSPFRSAPVAGLRKLRHPSRYPSKSSKITGTTLKKAFRYIGVDAVLGLYPPGLIEEGCGTVKSPHPSTSRN